MAGARVPPPPIQEVSPVEVVDAVLRRIEALQPTVNAFIAVTADAARADARRAEAAVMAGEALGPFHGVPVSVKDQVFTKGGAQDLAHSPTRDLGSASTTSHAAVAPEPVGGDARERR